MRAYGTQRTIKDTKFISDKGINKGLHVEHKEPQ
jgi:hypothetical protein